MSKIVHKTFNTEGYSVSEYGLVFSDKSKRFVSGWKDKQGYVRLRMNGKAYFIHRIVATKYIPNPEGKEEVNHINGIRHDNRVENLEWVTRSENQQHAFDTGLQVMKRGAADPKAVLTQEQAELMRHYYDVKDCATIRGLGREFGVSQRTAQRILRGEGYHAVIT